MPFRLGENGRTQRLQHALIIQSLQRDLIRRMEAGLDFPVGREPDAVAFGAEVCAHRADEADISPRAGKPVELCNAAVGRNGTQLRKPLGHDGVGDEGFRSEISAVVHGHELNKADVHRILLRESGKGGNLIVVEAADQHRIDLDLFKPRGKGGFDAGHGVFQVSDPGDVTELLRVQRVQTDVEPADTGFAQGSGKLREQCPVGGETDIFDSLHCCGGTAELDNIALDKRLSAGDAQLADPERGRGPDGGNHLFLGEHVLMTLFADTVLRHAVTAAQIAEFRDGKTEIGDLPSVGIDHSLFHLASRTGVPTRR